MAISFTNYVYAQGTWIHPFFEIRGKYDDNIFLTRDNEEDDWITTVSPGFVIEPRLNKHKFTCDYRADLRFFADHDDENSYNHSSYADLELDFNKFRFNLSNMFRHFSDRDSLSREDINKSATTEDFYYSYGRDRLGTDDISRIPRTQDYATAILTLPYNKLDLAFRGSYGIEKYHSSNAIGSFKGQSLTYKDLERDEYEGEVEVALKLWPKTALLFSGIYGEVDHDTGKKGDSSYFDLLVGLRGEPTAKCAVEAKIGYRDQDYKDYDDDFESLVFNGSLMQIFTPRDVLRINFLRTTNDTTYKENAYYKVTYIIVGFVHGFTDRFFGNLDFTYENDRYPSATTEAGKTAKRKDDFWSAGIGFSYKMVKWFVFDVQYEFRTRDCNFPTLDYENNRVSIGLRGNF